MNQEQFAKEVVRRLDHTTHRLPTEVKVRLAEARQMALARAQAGAQPIHRSGMTLISSYLFQHQRTLSLAALFVAVLFTFVVTQQLTGHGHAEHGDAFLLASELPPEAYLDQGFYSWLEQQ